MKRALLVIDVQESFRARPATWETLANRAIAEPVGRLIHHARAHGDLVVWILHTEPDTGNVFDPASGHVEPLAELPQPQPGEPVLTKTSHNTFTTTGLQRLLTAAGVRELVLCGIRTEQCVETTTRVGSDLGYDAVLVPDATATNPIPATDGTPALSAAQITERTVAVLRGRFARIATVAELLAEPRPATATTEAASDPAPSAAPVPSA